MSVQESETIAIMACKACGAAIPQSDRFCRSCGTGQTESLTKSAGERSVGSVAYDSAGLFKQPADYQTRVMPRNAICEPVSGPLVKAVADGLSAHMSLRFLDRRVKAIMLLLISVPLWLMIVLLSPLDTYAAVKAISGWKR
jgi:hypothetical protein